MILILILILIEMYFVFASQQTLNYFTLFVQPRHRTFACGTECVPKPSNISLVTPAIIIRIWKLLR